MTRVAIIGRAREYGISPNFVVVKLWQPKMNIDLKNWGEKKMDTFS